MPSSALSHTLLISAIGILTLQFTRPINRFSQDHHYFKPGELLPLAF